MAGVEPAYEEEFVDIRLEDAIEMGELVVEEVVEADVIPVRAAWAATTARDGETVSFTGFGDMVNSGEDGTDIVEDTVEETDKGLPVGPIRGSS